MADEETLSFTVQNVINDPDMGNLKVKDLKNFMLHMQAALQLDHPRDEEIKDEDLGRYIL